MVSIAAVFMCHCTLAMNRCQCGCCSAMPTAVECVCFTEIEEILNRKDQSQCITQHEGFEPVCLDVWVLQTAYFSYRQAYGTRDIQRQPLNEYVHQYIMYLNCSVISSLQAV